MLRAILASPINLLLVAAPISWVVDARAPESPWVFLTAAVSLIPLSGLIGLGTEELALRSGPAWGGFLNATFGNAAELIIAIVALHDGHIALVKASITGSIVGNLLLVLGLSFFVGGLGRRSQTFNRTAATNTAAMLFLAVVALIMPAVFDLTLYGSLAAHPAAIDRLSLWSALILIAAYGGSLIYAFTSQRDLFRMTHEGEHDAPRLSPSEALGVLAAGTILTTIQAEILVGAPAVVLYSMAIGHPMTLLFNAFEISAIALSVLATVIVVVDGESNWVEGLQLMSVYLILALAFYFVPV